MGLSAANYEGYLKLHYDFQFWRFFYANAAKNDVVSILPFLVSEKEIKA